MPRENEITSINTSEINPRNAADKKCAPGLTFDAGSCIKLHILIEMAKAYNSESEGQDAIQLYPELEMLNPRKYKKYLVKQFNIRMGDKCTTQKCWTEQSFKTQMKKIAKEEFEKYTFRPYGPEGRFEWLNTINIKEVMEQYEKKYPEFKFLGAVPIDFDEIMPKIRNLKYNDFAEHGKTKVGIVFNLDEHDQPGSHWVAMYGDLKKGEIYYYDSYAIIGETRIRSLARRLTKISKEGFGVKRVRATYNKTRHQYGNSECGVYSVNFIERLLNGDTFDQICADRTPDKQINLERNTYFYNVDIKEK
jgi:hypothetical protein